MCWSRVCTTSSLWWSVRLLLTVPQNSPQNKPRGAFCRKPQLTWPIYTPKPGVSFVFRVFFQTIYKQVPHFCKTPKTGLQKFSEFCKDATDNLTDYKTFRGFVRIKKTERWFTTVMWFKLLSDVASSSVPDVCFVQSWYNSSKSITSVSKSGMASPFAWSHLLSRLNHLASKAMIYVTMMEQFMRFKYAKNAPKRRVHTMPC